MSAPRPIIVPPQGKHTATVIVAHGLGDTGAGWAFLAEQFLSEKKFEQVKFIFPSAPSIPITINGGMRMPGWYDIMSLSSINRSDDEVGIARSAEYFHGLIKQEVDAGIPSERIVLGGFSQGGAMSLMAALTSRYKLGGIFGLSCYLLMQSKIQNMIEEKGNVNKDTNIFMAHGDADPVVRYEFGKLTAEKLKEWGYKVDFKTYPGMPHTAAPHEIDDLESFLNTAIPPKDDQTSSQGNL